VHSSQTPQAVGKVTAPPRRLIAIDLGAKRVGVAVSDELQITVTPLERIERRSWKDLLRRVAALIDDYDARALVIGLPLSLDGKENNAAQDAQRIAENFRKSLSVPVFLQDERLTTAAAESELRSRGAKASEVAKRIDSESAAIILHDFIAAKPDAEDAMDLECGGQRQPDTALDCSEFRLQADLAVSIKAPRKRGTPNHSSTGSYATQEKKQTNPARDSFCSRRGAWHLRALAVSRDAISCFS